MTKKGHNTWTSAQVKHYTCNFDETTTVHYPKLTLTEYPAAREGDDPHIHQSLTQTPCLYKKSYCIPQEYPKSLIIWPKVKHDSRLYHSMGIFPVKQIDNYFLIPALGIGGSSIDEDENGILLNDGYQIIKQSKGTYHTTESFNNHSKQYVRSTKSNVQRDLGGG